jgi:hypothetical protein
MRNGHYEYKEWPTNKKSTGGRINFLKKDLLATPILFRSSVKLPDVVLRYSI